VSYYLVRTTIDDDRPEYIAKEIARVVAVNFHEEVAARPWMIDLDRPYIIDDPKAWQRYNKLGNPIVPEEEEVVVDGVGEDGSPVGPEEQAEDV
jgi:hypothetical protein